MPETMERNPNRKVYGRYDNKEILKRIYKKEEIEEDGTVVYVRIQNGQLTIYEYSIELVGKKAIRFAEKGLLGKQIPITSIGFINSPKRKDLGITLEGSAISSDFDLLVNSMLIELEHYISQLRHLFTEQYSSVKETYLYWELECENDNEDKDVM